MVKKPGSRSSKDISRSSKPTSASSVKKPGKVGRALPAKEPAITGKIAGRARPTKKESPARPKAKPTKLVKPVKSPPTPRRKRSPKETIAPSSESITRTIENFYDARKERERDRQARQSKSGRDIAPTMPACQDLALRDKVTESLKLFCEKCLGERFTKDWSEDHKKAITKIERSVKKGELFAFAMPRGSGKTTLIVAAVLWAILCGYKRYVALIGADKEAATRLLSGVMVELESNETLHALFPEATHPIRMLEGQANRSRGQLFNGERTRIEWTKKTIVFATIPGAACSGAAIEVTGILGRVRGMQRVLPNGAVERPGLFFVDDPQTDRSAVSHTQILRRLTIITGGCLGLAGPGEPISGFVTCTVIADGDLACKILDTELYPDWQGERCQLVYAWPTNTELWEEYANLRAEGIGRCVGIKLATAFYKANRKAMDAGAKVAWADRFEPGELSAIQHAFNLRLKLGDTFWAEYQNQPKSADDDVELLKIDAIQAKVCGFPRHTISPDGDLVTCYIDVQGKLLYYMAVAWRSSDFSGWVIDYGTWPNQSAMHFNLRSVTKTLAVQYPRRGQEGRVRQGLLDLIDQLAQREYVMPDMTRVKLRRIGVDAAWGASTRTVESVCIESPHRNLLLPCFGRGIKAKDAPMMTWKQKRGERKGHNWILRPTPGGGVHCLIDTNHWKTFAHARLSVAAGDPGAVCLYSPSRQTEHRMLSEHFRAEIASETTNGERVVIAWELPPSKPDNHLFDCYTGATALASLEGATLRESLLESPRRHRAQKRAPVILKT